MNSQYNIDTFLKSVYQLSVGVELVKIFALKKMILDSKRIFLIGNGGSAAICDHIANDLMKRCKKYAITLSSPSLTTCLANDFGFEYMFFEFLNCHRISEEDLLIAISSSGKSADITKSIEFANALGSTVIGMSGFDGWDEEIEQMLNLNIWFNSKNYGEVEMSTELVLHGIIEDIVINKNNG